ncbi:cob(I)yrinic acid a,c-diamide adenosyltransferase [Lachnospiraceae bacterium HCP1S3_C3]
MQGLVHLYCGNGKGKTTAAAGLALRAVGAGMRVVFVQFLKGSETGEIEVLKKLDNVTVIRNYKDLGFVSNMTPEEVEEVRKMHNKSIDEATEIVSAEKCDMLVLDEVCAAYNLDVLDKEKIKKLIEGRPDNMELVFTGRAPDKIFMDSADYITEMKQVRHPFEKNIKARKGIEY